MTTCSYSGVYIYSYQEKKIDFEALKIPVSNTWGKRFGPGIGWFRPDFYL